MSRYGQVLMLWLISTFLQVASTHQTGVLVSENAGIKLETLVRSSVRQLEELKSDLNITFHDTVKSVPRESSLIMVSACAEFTTEETRLLFIYEQAMKKALLVHYNGCRRMPNKVTIPVSHGFLQSDSLLLQLLADLRHQYKMFNSQTAIVYDSKIDYNFISLVSRVLTSKGRSEDSTAFITLMADYFKQTHFKTALISTLVNLKPKSILILDATSGTTTTSVLSTMDDVSKVNVKSRWIFVQLGDPKNFKGISLADFQHLRRFSSHVLLAKRSETCKATVSSKECENVPPDSYKLLMEGHLSSLLYKVEDPLTCQLKGIFEKLDTNVTRNCTMCYLKKEELKDISCSCTTGFSLNVMSGLSHTSANYNNSKDNELLEWSSLEGLPISKFFTGNSFNNREVSIVTFHAPPYVMREMSSDGKITWSGLIFDILNVLSLRLNFRMKINEISGNDLYEHAINIVSRQGAEIAALPLLYSEERLRKVNFTDPFDNNQITFVTYKPDYSYRDFLFLEPFTTSTWIALATVVLLMGPILYAIHRYSLYYRKYGQSMKSKGLCSFRNCSWYIFGTMVNQGGIHLPLADSGRIMIAFWWMFQIITVTTYSGNLVAFLTFPKQNNPFDSIINLRKSDLKWAAIKQSSTLYLGKRAKEGLLKEISAKTKHYEIDSIDLAISKVRDKKEILFHDKVMILLAQKNDYDTIHECNMEVSTKIISEDPLGLAVPANADYLPSLNAEIRKMLDSGLVDKWKRKYWPKENACTVKGKIQSDNNRTVTLSQILGSFYVLAIGFGSSICLLLAEKGFRMYVNRKHQVTRVHSIEEHLKSNNKSNFALRVTQT